MIEKSIPVKNTEFWFMRKTNTLQYINKKWGIVLRVKQAHIFENMCFLLNFYSNKLKCHAA